MENNQLNIDETSRDKIRNNIHENYFVEAGAGSGKTTILVDRMIKMVEEDIDISLISAITFTKAAANEFYERFQSGLIEKSLENNKYKDKYLNALQNIDLAFMGTIDAFCNMIMSEHPTEGLIPSNASVIDDVKAQEIYKREYANIQNGIYNDEILEKKALNFLKFDNRAEETFIYTINALLSHRDCKLTIPNYSIVDLDVKYEDQIKTIRKIVNVLNDHPEYIISSNEDNADNLRKAFKQYKNTFNNKWDNNISNVLFAFSKTFLESNFRLPLDPIIEKDLKEGIDYFVDNPGKGKWRIVNPDKINKLVDEINELKYVVTIDFVNNAKDKILEKLRKEGSLTFNDYLVYLRDTLRKDAKEGGKLIKHISKRHRYFLIDEFQDTDPIQSEIFFYLASDEIKENWKDCIPHKGSLFIVGDPKQSIYRFKNADVASYLNVEKMFAQPIGEVLHLYQNFRSTYEVKDWFNKTFVSILEKSDEQAEFKEIPNKKEDALGGFSGVYRYGVPWTYTDETDYDKYKVKEIILKLYDNPNYQICEKNKAGEIIKRNLDFKDFMVITPSKPALADYTKIFRENGIPYYVEGNIKFNESKAFEMFADFFGAIIDPYDNRNLYSILKSNLYNITEKELLDLKQPLSFLINLETVNISNNLKNALIQIQSFVKDAKVLSPSSLFSKIIENVEAFKKQGVDNMEYVYFALELLKAKEASKEIITNLDAFAFFNKLLYEKNDQERCPGLKKDGNQVHLANLHKVKGLEAPVVILAHPRTIKREPEFRMVRKDDGNIGYLFNVTKLGPKHNHIKLIETKKYDNDLKLDEESSSNAELLRLEYVAATRARNVLIISATVTQKGLSSVNPWLDLLTNGPCDTLDDIELVLTNEKVKQLSSNPIDYDEVSKSPSIINENRKDLEKSSYELTNPSKLAHSIDIKEYEEIGYRENKQSLENGTDTMSTITGTMVHRLLEIIVITKDNVDKNKLINSIVLENNKPEFKGQENSFKDLLSRIYDTLHNGGFDQKGNAPKDILKELKQADEVYAEIPFNYLLDSNKLLNGIIDLVYLKDNKLHIIDWKTNKDDSNLDELYKNQLDAYKQAIKQILDKEVEDALIYHIET